MSKYELSVEKTVKRLIPPYLRRPRQTQWLLSLTYPLRYVNTIFRDFVDKSRVEASLNSQTQLFEKYLNDTFRQYFSLLSDRIEIVHDVDLSKEIFYSFEEGAIDVPLFFKSEGEDDPEFFYKSENAGQLDTSFKVLLPKSLEGNSNVVGQIIDLIEKYRISAFDYEIQYV